MARATVATADANVCFRPKADIKIEVTGVRAVAGQYVEQDAGDASRQD